MQATHPFTIGDRVQRVNTHDSAEVGEIVEVDGSQVRVFWPQGGPLGRGCRTWLRCDQLTTPRTMAQTERRAQGVKPVTQSKPKPVKIEATYRVLFGNYCVAAYQGDEALSWDTVDDREAEIARLLALYPGAKVTRW